MILGLKKGVLLRHLDECSTIVIDLHNIDVVVDD